MINTYDNTHIINFLIKLENNKSMIFDAFPDFILIPMTAFCLLAELDNIHEIINAIFEMENELNCFILNIEGCLAIAISDSIVHLEKLKFYFEKIFEMMRFSKI